MPNILVDLIVMVLVGGIRWKIFVIDQVAGENFVEHSEGHWDEFLNIWTYDW